MKIVHLMGYFVPELGYQEYYLAKKHKEMGHDVYVIASDMLYPFPNIEGMLKEAGAKNTSRKRKSGFSVIDGINVYRLPHLLEYSDFILPKGLKKTLKKINPDIVFAHESRQGMPALGALYKKNFGYKLVVDQHDFYHKIPNHPSYKKLLRFLDYFLFRKFVVNFSLKKADKVVAVTNETKEFLTKTHRIKNVELIPLGVDTDFFKFNAKIKDKTRKKLRIRKDETVLVFSGTIIRRKGLEILLESLSDITKKDKNVRLVILGSGDQNYMKELKDLAKKLSLERNTIFTGFVDKKKVKDYFSAADIGVWPGNNSVSIMEAMACKLPIVMVDLQLTHLVGHGNGLSFKSNDKEGLKKALLELIKDKSLRKKMSENSLKAIRQRYSYNIIAKRFLDTIL